MALLSKAEIERLGKEEGATKDASEERKQGIIAEEIQIKTSNELATKPGTSQATCVALPLHLAKPAQLKTDGPSTSDAADATNNTNFMPWSKAKTLNNDGQKSVGSAKAYKRVPGSAGAAANVDASATKRMPWSKPLELKGGGPKSAATSGPTAKLMQLSKLLMAATDNTKGASHNNARTYNERSKSKGKAPVPKYKVHPLLSSWTLWYHKTERCKPWEECLHMVGTFDTVEGFWNLYDALEPPSGLNWNSDYFVFREGIKPLWEDEANKRGGRWVAKNVPSDKLDAYWLNLLLAMIGMEFDPHGQLVCGAAVSIRQKGRDKISVWTTDSLNDDANMEIGKTLKEELEMPDSQWLRYEVHRDASNRLGSCVKPSLRLPMHNPTTTRTGASS